MFNRNNPINPDSNRDPRGGWVRNPYGINISSDETTLFQTLSEAFRFSTDSYSEDTKTKQDIVRWQQVANAIDLSNAKDASVKDLGQGEVFYCKQGYTDTSVGGNDAINPYWQFNRDDDIVPPHLRSMYKTKDRHGTNEGATGMGRVYSEMYDDNQQLLWLSAGVPIFTNLGTFFYEAGDSNTAKLMNNGDHGWLIGNLISFAKGVTWWAFTFPIMAPIYLVRWCSNFNNEPITKYYAFKPTQSLYLELVNTMLSYLAVGMGLYPQIRMDMRPDDKQLSHEWSPGEIDKMIPEAISDPTDRKETGEMLAKLLARGNAESGIPELLRQGPDIFKITNKRNIQFDLLKSNYSTRDLTQAAAEINTYGSKKSAAAKQMFVGAGEGGMQLTLVELEAQLADKDKQIKKMGNHNLGYQALIDERNKMREERKSRRAAGEKPEKVRTFMEQAGLSLMSAILGTGDYIGFRVEKNVDASESIQNSTGPTGLADKLNGYASSQMEARMSFGGSSTLKLLDKFGDGGISGLMKSAMKAITFNLIGGIASVVENGNGYLDIPEVWKSSTFTKSHNFTIQLRARYGDPVSIYQSIYIPLVMLLAYAMPRGVGKNMYTSPFIVRCYCKGMFSVPAGMVDNMTITRGASEYGWSSGNLPTAVDVRFSIKDLSPTFFLSASGGIGLKDLFKANTNMMEYLDTLSGLGIVEKLYIMPKLLRKSAAMFLIKRNTLFSPLYWTQAVGRSAALRLAGSIVPQQNIESPNPYKL